jgi:hypothetical protein
VHAFAGLDEMRERGHYGCVELSDTANGKVLADAVRFSKEGR